MRPLSKSYPKNHVSYIAAILSNSQINFQYLLWVDKRPHAMKANQIT